ncbi:MAG: radical SAM protein [Candidatus Auribacterota bacterium]|nr:radical SAM protein [Candidatus Auribacterota bacterium]
MKTIRLIRPIRLILKKTLQMKKKIINDNPNEESAATNIWEKARAERIPILGSIELTRRCNLKCPYCYVGFARNIPSENELNREEICSLFDQFAEKGCLFLTFTGGEPFFHDDFRSIYRYALQKGFLITIFTNGTLIDREMADFLANYPPLTIDITIFGATEDIYERVSGVKGSYQRCRKAIKLLDERTIPFGLKSVISTINREEIREMKKFAEGFGKQFRFDTLICPDLNGSHHGTKYRLSPREIIQLDYKDPERWKRWLSFDCREWGPAQSDRLYKCGGGLCSFHVSSSGQLGLCVLDTNFRYDLIKGSFQDGWERFIPWVRKKIAQEGNKCGSCEIRSLCSICPAWSTLETGSPEKSVDFLCQIAHFRATLLKKARRKHNEKKETISKA